MKNKENTLIKVDTKEFKTINETLFGIGEMMQKTGKVISEALSFTQKISEAVSAQLKSITIPHIDWENLKQGILETEEDIKIFKVAMVEMKYPPHDGMDIIEMRKIANKYNNNKEDLEKNIDEIMNELYQPREMMKILLGWERTTLINKRLPLLRNAIMAHNLGMYDLVVPSVLSQLEGLLVDIFNITGRVDGEIQKILLNELLLNNEYFDNTYSFDNAIHTYYKENILVGFEHGKITQSELSRHSILHGSNTYFGKQANSLKVILLFDYLVNAAEHIEAEDIERTRRKVNEIQVKRKSKKR